MTRGFLLGKFMPPHAGHQLLVETAAALVDRLTVLVRWAQVGGTGAARLSNALAAIDAAGL